MGKDYLSCNLCTEHRLSYIMTKLKAAIIVDNMQIAKWQKSALDYASDVLDVRYILNCTNTTSQKDVVKNFLYYGLNVISLRNSETVKTEIRSDSAKVVTFEALQKGSWQRFSKHISSEINPNDFDVIIKFGMSLLRIDGPLSNIPVLSFHHGDPSKYRGRPAGFYELANNEDKLGIIVQKLSNKLDAGEVYAFAYSKINHTSYKKTALNFYKVSKFMLRQAVINLQNKTPLTLSKTGENYTLPTNSKVLKFGTKLAMRKTKHLLYGAFYEKKWNVALCPFDRSFEGDVVLQKASFQELPIEPQYSFYADPFFSGTGREIRFEAMDKKTGLGDIVEIDRVLKNNAALILSGKHYSYPYTFTYKNAEYVLPEVASHSAPYYFNVKDGPDKKIAIKGLEDLRIVDASLIESDDQVYLFFGLQENAANVLQLYVSNSLNGTFNQHPASPIALDPECSRMGGRLIKRDGKTYRFGQNNMRGYGASISILEINTLTSTAYKETKVGSFSIDDGLGPHTIDLSPEGDTLLFDFYTQKFSVFAGYRRLLNKLASR